MGDAAAVNALASRRNIWSDRTAARSSAVAVGVGLRPRFRPDLTFTSPVVSSTTQAARWSASLSLPTDPSFRNNTPSTHFVYGKHGCPAALLRTSHALGSKAKDTLREPYGPRGSLYPDSNGSQSMWSANGYRPSRILGQQCPHLIDLGPLPRDDRRAP